MEPKLIANFASGLNEVYKPWLMPEDAFPTLSNAYLWRGNLQKRQGFSRLTDVSQPTPLAPGPVMGLITRLDADNGDPSLIGFNRTKAFEFFTGTSTFADISGSTLWTGSNADFFWGFNGFRSLFVTNGVDPIRYYNQYDTTWYNLTPIVSGTDTLDTALIVVAHKGVLIALNTIENSTRFAQRARWSKSLNPYATGTPPVGYTVDPNCWRDDIIGNGGFVDADINEDIVSVGFNKDNLIVFFENSTWRLRYTGNPFNLFQWEIVNTQLGSESTFSTVAFDEGVLTTSRRGIVAASTNEVKRIDEKIPNMAISFQTSNAGMKRIQAGRDFYRELVAWIYCDGNDSVAETNKVLLYNYRQPSWATFDLSFTCFGSGATTNSLIWDEADFTWDSSEADISWDNTATNDGSPFIVAGTASGEVLSFLSSTQDNGLNFNFDIWTKRFMFYGEQGKKARLCYVDLYLTGTTGGEFSVEHYIDEDTATPVSTQSVSSSSTKDTLYTRVYLGAIGRTHQLRFFLSGSQLGNTLQGAAPWELQAMVLWIQPAGRINDP